MSRPSFAFQPRCALVGLVLTLAGCIEPSPRSDITRTLNAVSFEPPRATAPGALPATAAVGPVQPGEAPLQAQIYGGRTVTAQRPATGGAQRTADGVQLNFEQAEIRDVIKVILGDIIGRSYTVDSDVQGQVTLSTSAPMSEGDLLAVLETVLRANGATLVEASPDTFRIMPVDAAIGRSQVVPLGGQPVQVRPGYGITIVPLRNISATSAAQFIQPLVASPEDIRIDPGRNAILFSGTGIERQNVVETIADLDVDWMSGKAIGLFPLERANVESIIPELQAIFAPFDPTGSEPSLVRFLPLARLNAVLAIAGDPEQVREVGAWVSRLDHGQAVGSQFYVYNLKHGAAEDIAKLLNEAFGEGPASGAGPSLAAASATLGAPPSLSEDGEPAPTDEFGEQPGQAPAESPTTSGPIKVVASKANNSLLIRATPEEYDRIEATLARLDTAPWQVLIEATIAEVTLTDALRYGVQYFLQQGSFAAGFTTLTGVATRLLPPNPVNPGFNFLFTPGSSSIVIDALSQFTDVKVLSAPSVVVQDNSEAVLNVGEEVPVQTQQQQSLQASDANILNSIEYRDTGVILQVRPRINSNQAVSLEIAQEVSRVNTQAASTASNALTPQFTQRKITSRINVQSGQTVVLGGLIQDSEERGRSRIPLLGEIPVLGNLFGTTSNTEYPHRADRVPHATGHPQPRGRARRQRGAALSAEIAAAGRRPSAGHGGAVHTAARAAAGSLLSSAADGPARAAAAESVRPVAGPCGLGGALDLASEVLTGALLGLCVGSFVGTVVLREASGWRGLLLGRSACPACGTRLTARDLVPLWSWLAARGRCRHCGAAAPAFYPLVELAAAVIGALALTTIEAPVSLITAVLGWWLLALALIDLRTWRLPDALTLPLIAAGLGAAALDLLPAVRLLHSLVGAAVGYLALAGVGWAYRRLRGRDGLGLGDAKLLAAAGAWLGAEALPWLVLTAAILGLALALTRARPVRAETAVPFGPPLALAFWSLFVAQAAG